MEIPLILVNLYVYNISENCIVMSSLTKNNKLSAPMMLLHNINHRVRYQKGLKVSHIFVAAKGVCACGCKKPLTGRQKKWASRECNDKAYNTLAIVKGNNRAIRKALFRKEEGFCRHCGVFDSKWQADHIRPVQNNGGGYGIENFQTLCESCHNEKTRDQMESHRTKISSQQTFKVSNVLIYAAGEAA